LSFCTIALATRKESVRLAPFFFPATPSPYDPTTLSAMEE
jgi:hypothetical protein